MIETRNVYVQLLDLCQHDLAAGKWAIGEKFPSERELAAMHGISRATANKVVAKLSSEGWLEIRRGSGVYVADRPTLFSELRQMDSFTDFAQTNQLAPSTEVIACEVRPVDEHTRGKLAIQTRNNVIYVERLRQLNGVTVIHEARWLPAKLYPNLKPKDLAGSFYALCRERYNLQVDREDATVRATTTPKAVDFHGAAALRFNGTGYDAGGQPLWMQELHYHGECFELHHSTEITDSFPRLNLRIAQDFIERRLAKHKNND